MLPSDEPQHKLQRGLMEYTLKITQLDSLRLWAGGRRHSSPWQPQVHDGGSKYTANVPVISETDPYCRFCSRFRHFRNWRCDFFPFKFHYSFIQLCLIQSTRPWSWQRSPAAQLGLVMLASPLFPCCLGLDNVILQRAGPIAHSLARPQQRWALSCVYTLTHKKKYFHVQPDVLYELC